MGLEKAVPFRIRLGLATACLLGVIAGCVEPSAPTVRLHIERDGAESMSRPVLPGSTAFFEPAEQVVRLSGALNEVLDFRLLVAAEIGAALEAEVDGVVLPR